MTNKLYYLSSTIFEFYATVTSCIKSDNGYNITLNETAFFPESGGQCCDTGTIGDSKVSYVFEENDDIIHTVDKEVEVGVSLLCSLDKNKRFRNMQNHTGEHIISGLVYKYFGFQNVGFHLGNENITCDFNGKLTREDLLKIEREANEAVVKCSGVTAWFPSNEELVNLEYRCKSEISGAVRLVKINGYDLCACCAPHVENCGQIGIIKILDFEAYKGGTRVSIKCGFDALNDYNDKYFNVLSISALLSAKQHETALATEHLKKENDILKQQIKNLKEQILRSIADEYQYTDNVIVYEHSENDMNELRIIADALADKTDKFSVVFYSSENNISFSAISKTKALTQLSKELREKYGARCGGKDNILQGNVMLNAETFIEIIKKISI